MDIEACLLQSPMTVSPTPITPIPTGDILEVKRRQYQNPTPPHGRVWLTPANVRPLSTPHTTPQAMGSRGTHVPPNVVSETNSARYALPSPVNLLGAFNHPSPGPITPQSSRNLRRLITATSQPLLLTPSPEPAATPMEHRGELGATRTLPASSRQLREEHKDVDIMRRLPRELKSGEAYSLEAPVQRAQRENERIHSPAIVYSQQTQPTSQGLSAMRTRRRKRPRSPV